MKGQYITIEKLKKLDDSSYVYFNTNILYYLLSKYNSEKESKPKDEYFNQCINIILNYLDELKILEYYGYEFGNSCYHCLKVFDAKMLFRFYEDKNGYLPLTTLKYCRKAPFYIYYMEELKKGYQRIMYNKTIEEQNRKELKRRNEQGYML